MSATSHFIRSGDQNLHYLQYGNGPRLLLAFHGYGHDATSFEVLIPFLQERYTILCIDLPHHGQTDWASGKTLSITALAALTAEKNALEARLQKIDASLESEKRKGVNKLRSLRK